MSRVYLKPLDDILTENNEKRAFLYGVASYLKNLNTFASSKKTPNLTEYNVGGVISIVEQIETLAETYMSSDDQSWVAKESEECYNLLLASWFCYQDSKDQLDPVKMDNFFASDYDVSGKLPLRIGQFLITLEPAINTYKYEMFKVSFNLLARYSDHIKKGELIPITDANDDSYLKYKQEVLDQGHADLQALLRSFKTLFKLKNVDKRNFCTEGFKLRQKGNEYLKQKRYGAAIGKYTEGLNLDPSNYAILSNRAAVFTLVNDPESAIEDLKKAIRIDPGYETAWARLGFSYLSIGDSLKSVEAYAKAIRLASDKNMIVPYIKKLCESLRQAEARARSNGLSDRLPQFLDPIQSILNANQTTRPQSQPTAASQNQHNQRRGSPIPNVNDLNQPGLIQEQLQNMFQQFRNSNGGGDAGNGQGGNFVSALNGIGSVLAGSDTFRNFVNSNRTQEQAGNPQPDVADDPESMAPEEIHNQNNPQPSQGISDIIRNSLPEGLRNTIGPALRMAMNNPGNNQFGSNSPEGINGEVIFTTITTGPNGEIIHHATTGPHAHEHDHDHDHDHDHEEDVHRDNNEAAASTQQPNSPHDHELDPEDFDLD